jgi:hypothetical protein
MLVSAIFAHFGRQNRLFGHNATDREKMQDWLAEEIGLELVVAFRRTIALYWPTKVPISPVCGKQRVQTGESGRLHGTGSSGAKQKVSFLS